MRSGRTDEQSRNDIGQITWDVRRPDFDVEVAEYEVRGLLGGAGGTSGAGGLRELFVCDSTSAAVVEAWFRDLVVPHSRAGIQVKVVAADRLDDVEDFDKSWQQAGDALRVLDSTGRERVATNALEVFGTGKISDAFGGAVVLRGMRRLDDETSLLRDDEKFVRKYEMRYAEAFSEHFKSVWPDVERIVFVGDTFKNDATVVRHLQALGWNCAGFICDPKLGLGALVFDGLVYTDDWTDIVQFAHDFVGKPDSRLLAIVDMDQTFWSPKGVHEGPLGATRVRAIYRTMRAYMDNSPPEVVERVQSLVSEVYACISSQRYIASLTLDNEDFKAAISLFAVFSALDALDDDALAGELRDSIIPSLVAGSDTGEQNFESFLAEALRQFKTAEFADLAARRGVDAAALIADAQSVLDMTRAGDPVPFPKFRAAERNEALDATDPAGDFANRLVINKAVWDFTMWLKSADAKVMGISDRPDQSTVGDDGTSLLDAPMSIYGKAIAQWL